MHGPMTPRNGEAPTSAKGQGFLSTKNGTEGFHCAMPSYAEEAALQIEGEEYATQYLERLRAGTAEMDELAMLSAFMHSGPLLTGFTKVIRKALHQGVSA